MLAGYHGPTLGGVKREKYFPTVPERKLPVVVAATGMKNAANKQSTPPGIGRGAQDGAMLPRLVDQGSKIDFGTISPPKEPEQAWQALPKVPVVTLKKMYSSFKSSSAPADPGENLNTLMGHDVPGPLPWQTRNFRSSTMLRCVPIARRHQDMFAGHSFSIAKTRPVAFHTDRYMWDPSKLPSAEEELQQSRDKSGTNLTVTGLSPLLAQKERFEKELREMEEIRGQKRKREVIPHRLRFNMSMEGRPAEYTERYDIAAEVQKLKSIILPPAAKETYMGRGFRFPEDHFTKRPPIVREPKVPAPPVNSRLSQPEDGDLRESKVRRQVTIRTPRRPTRDIPSELSDQESLDSAIGGRVKKETMRPSRRPLESAPPPEPPPPIPEPPVEQSASDQEPEEKELEPQPGPAPLPPTVDPEPEPAEAQMEIQSVSLAGDVAEDKLDEGEEQMEMEPSITTASPEKDVSSNLLQTTKLSRLVSETEKAMYERQFKKLDTDKDGHITFAEMKTQMPENLSKAQSKYVKQVYDITSSSTFFGLEEFISLSLLCETMSRVGNTMREMYEQIDFGALSESISQYVELFSSVDRQQTGSITMNSLQGILSTTLGRDLQSDQRLQAQIYSALEKIEHSPVTYMEYMAYIPYFLYLEGMSGAS
ncbi:uncharacterized protein [Branchiostoma lanceolatum]|uniref:uncharacterized protein isoform X1 n=1 Tax=Branchiostoma lanceolatum TaxID=7740 RepID=UPI003454AFE8